MAEPDAQQILGTLLKAMGLDSLTSDVWGALTSGKITSTTPIDQIGYQIRDTKAYRDRFAGNITLRDKNKPEFSITDYLAQERAYKNAIQGSGLPSGFYDTPEAYAKFIGGDISPAEIKNRVDNGYMAVKDANPEVLRQLKEFYPDVNTGDIAAYFMNPEVGTDIIVNRAKVAQIGSEAKRQAGISITEQQAQALRQEGVGQKEAMLGFTTIAQEKDLYAPMVQGEEAISQEEQIAGAFKTSAAATQRIAQRKRKRAAEFEAGGGFAASQQGSTGLRTVGE